MSINQTKPLTDLWITLSSWFCNILTFQCFRVNHFARYRTHVLWQHVNYQVRDELAKIRIGFGILWNDFLLLWSGCITHGPVGKGWATNFVAAIEMVITAMFNFEGGQLGLSMEQHGGNNINYSMGWFCPIFWSRCLTKILMTTNNFLFRWDPEASHLHGMPNLLSMDSGSNWRGFQLLRIQPVGSWMSDSGDVRIKIKFYLKTWSIYTVIDILAHIILHWLSRRLPLIAKQMLMKYF